MLYGIVALAFLLFGLWNGPWGCMGHRLDFLPGDLGDTRLNIYLLEHGYQWLSGKAPSFWDAPFMHPVPATITFSENFLGALPPYALLRFLGVERDLAFQLWVLLMFAFTFMASLVVFKKLTANFWVALAGAYFFAFGLSMVTNYAHAQTFARFCIPVAFYGLLRYVDTAQTRHFALLAFAVVWQLYCGLYLGILLILGLASVFVAHMWAHGPTSLTCVLWNRKQLISQLAILLVSVLVVLPLLLPYQAQSKMLEGRNFADVLPTIPTLASHFYTTWGPKLWGFLAAAPPPVDGPFWLHYLFMGAAPWIAFMIGSIVAVRHWATPRNALLQTTVAGLFLLFLFTTQFDGCSLYKLIWHLPGFNSIRDVHRVVCIQSALFSFVLVVVASQVLSIRYLMAKGAFLLPIAVLTDALFDPDTIARVEVQRCQDIERPIVQAMGQPESALQSVAFVPLRKESYLADYSGGPLAYQITAMLAAQKANLPTVNGYSGYFPSGFSNFIHQPSLVALHKWMQTNKAEQVTPIIDTLVQPTKIELVSFRTISGLYLCSEASLNPQKVIANRNSVAEWEIFGLLWYGNRCLIQTHDLQYLRVDKNQLLIADIGISKASWFIISQTQNSFVLTDQLEKPIEFLTDNGPVKMGISPDNEQFETIIHFVFE